MTDPADHSESGAPIYRHQPRERPFELAIGDEASIAAISRHIEHYVGTPETVFHELISDLVHVDVHVVAPTAERDYWTLITSGMSGRPMSPPPDWDELRYAELVVCLPSSWPLTEEAFKDERNYWPIRWLKILARLPHEYNTWLWEGHTVPHGDPAKPFAENTKLCCALLLKPMLFDEGFQSLTVNDDKVIHFFSLVPLYREEMELKMRAGLESLVERLEAAGVSELLDVRRKNVCKK